MKEKEKTYLDVADKGIAEFAGQIGIRDYEKLKWQRIAFISMAIAAISVVGVVYTATRSSFIPYVVTVDSNTGYATSLGALTEVDHTLTDAEINYFLSHFVEKIRSIPLDEEVLKRNMEESVPYLTDDSAKKFKDLYLSEFSQKIGTGKNRVHIISVQPVAKSADTYQIRWTESFSPLGTGTVKETHYTGIFKIRQESTKDKEQLKINPLGIMIEDFSIIEDASKQEKGEKK